ncbi:MAG: permease [Gammaproteobacteria bacterium]|nr:MAG: permease [Gammaproteobacteria bacterium]
MYLRLFNQLLRESFRDLLPVVAVIVFFQLTVIQALPENWIPTTVGMFIVGIGLAIFLLGLEIGIFPVGEDLAKNFAKSQRLLWLLLFGFLVGFGTTVAEPALIIIAEKAASISQGRIDATILRIVVALSVGLAILLGVWRIIKGHPIHYYIIAGYIAVVSVTFFAPPEIIGLAYDLGGVTTSTVTVPLVAALGIGLAASINGRNPIIDGFGLIALASLTPMVFVQIYGIAVYQFVEAQAVAAVSIDANTSEAVTLSLQYLLDGIVATTLDVLPIIAIILFFQFVVLKKPLANWQRVVAGFILVIVGLQAFIVGLEMGLFSLGETIALELTALDSVWTIYAFALFIGLSTTFAEPALIAIGKKSVEISDGRINGLWLRSFVAAGVGIGVMLGAYRIVTGEHIHYYIIAGYAVVIVLTSFAPRYIIPIAYDSGGVTTSTVTVPLVTALGIGLANNIEGRNALIDGFGLIAFASLFPIISVMLYGILIERMGVKTDTEIEAHEEAPHVILPNLANPFSHVSEHSVLINGKHEPMLATELNLSFTALVVIVPKDKKEVAVEAAKSAGASGVTMLDAEGMGLSKFDNLFRVNHEISDSVLLFILPDHMIKDTLHAIIQRLHINSEADGIAFTFPIHQLNGISLRQADVFTEKQVVVNNPA